MPCLVQEAAGLFEREFHDVRSQQLSTLQSDSRLPALP
eukprot:CAMPEP_0172762220 /NCGR_PEP_ID=MMETSP1074-20121228/173008_1 /TAXON_ID=2916 /ORGANISM="Ceratium fusus, Strain PA161109" /LENGTH=37 /DNA_ID= /DNA_START= /DNA_END= /DNA_ORIENTATION=